MFEYISGTLKKASPNNAVIDVGGVGYSLTISGFTFNRLPHVENTVLLYSHFYVREDTQKLFGFFAEEERDLFRVLITVNKVGPKVAINILSALSVSDIVHAVSVQDSSRFKAVSGIGPKTAQRIVMELKGKLKIETILTPASGTPESAQLSSGNFTARDDAFAALISLGYTEQQVISALSRVEEVHDDKTPVEEWVKKALKVI